MYKLAVWESEKRLSDSEAKLVYEKALNGSGFDASDRLADFESEAKECGAEIIKSMGGFIVVETPDEDVFDELVYYCVDYELTLFSVSENRLITSAGRYGTGAYVLVGENFAKHFTNNPKDADVEQEIDCLNEEDNSFLIFEGPDGYMQTAFNGEDGYVLEWNKGYTEEHYMLDKEPNASDVKKIFRLFLNNDQKSLDAFKWQKMEF